jgi:hypothetical protein
MNGCTTPLIWGWPADFVDVSHLWPLSVMAGVPPDAVAAVPTDDLDELRDDLEFEIAALRRDLRTRGYDMADIRDVVKETRAQQLPLDAQIQILQKFAARIKNLLLKPPSSTTPSALLSASAPPQIGSAPPLIAPPLIGPAPSSNSPSTLLSASAPSADALATCGKHVNDPRQRQGLTGRRRISYVDPAGPKGPKVIQHGEYKCTAAMHARTYHKAVGMATFIYDALIKVRDLDSWTCLNKPFMASLPYSAEIKQ